MGSALGRRSFLLACAGGAAAACAPASGGGAVADAEVYVGLGRARAIAVLDVVTDTIRGHIALAPLGARGLPWRIGVGPGGEAGVVPIAPLVADGPSVGVVGQSVTLRGDRAAAGAAQGGVAGRGAARTRSGGRCDLVRVGTGQHRTAAFGMSETAQALTADANGRAYVLVGEGSGAGPSYAAVVDLRSGALRRHLPLAAAGESVLALMAHADGERLFAAVWSWQTPSAGWGRGAGPGRLVAIDTRTGRALAQAQLPPGAAVTDLAVAAAPPTAGRLGNAGRHAVFAVVADPGPSTDDDWWVPGTRFSLMAFDTDALVDAGAWPLDARPTSVAVLPDGRRAYVLEGSLYGARAGSLVSLDLASGVSVRRWPMPTGALALAVSPAGKAYVADGFGDRLVRVDTQTDTLLGDLPMRGAPIALASRPY